MDRYWLLTSSLQENWLVRPANRSRLVRFHEQLPAMPDITIIPAGRVLLDQGFDLYRQRPDKEWSLTDCISFVVMQREGISEALTGPRSPRAVERGTRTALPWRFGRVRKLPGRVNRMTETISPDSGPQ
jgi:hypothetical protein